MRFSFVHRLNILKADFEGSYRRLHYLSSEWRKEGLFRAKTGARWLNTVTKYHFDRFFEVMTREIVLKVKSPWGNPIKFSLSNLCGHGAFLFLAISYTETNFFHLRVYASSGILLSIFFQYYRDKPLWIPIKWNALFLAINLFMIGKIIRERNLASRLSAEQMRIYSDVFDTTGMTDVGYYYLISCAERRVVRKGEKIISQNETNEHLSLIVKGSMDILRESEKVNSVKAEQFCGEMSFMQWKNELARQRKENPQEAVDPSKVHVRGLANVVASEDTIVYSWTFSTLNMLFSSHPDIGFALEKVLSNDLNNKMKSTWKIEPLVQYKQLLMGCVADGLVQIFLPPCCAAVVTGGCLCVSLQVTPEETELLASFRRDHGVTSAQHDGVLEELSWTPQEFSVGFKG
jgi:hypothetical protein